MRLSGKEIATLITSIPESGMDIPDDIQDWGLKTREDNNPDKPRNQRLHVIMESTRIIRSLLISMAEDGSKI